MFIHNIYIQSVLENNAEMLRAAGIALAPPLVHSISAYCELLLRWNRKISLTSITDPREVLERNFIESFYGVRWLGADSGTLCDIGSGAGFPALALKLVRPTWSMRLFEPNLKKAAFLAEVIRELKLTNVEVVHSRWQQADLDENTIDAVTARALGGYEDLARWASRILRPSGRIILWIGAEEAEKLRGLAGWRWETGEPVGSRQRVILAGIPASLP